MKTRITKKSCLLKALKTLGFTEGKVDCFDTPVALKGYQGDDRAQKAHVRIKGSAWKGQNYVGGASNDLGWELMNDGTYAFHVSDYDRSKYNQAWVDRLAREYSREVIREVAEERNFFIDQETEQNGEITIKVRSIY